MDKKVFPNSKVQEFLATSYVNVKVNADTPQGKNLMRQYGVRGIPCLMVFQPDGQLRGKMSGAPSDPDSFVSFVTGLANGQMH